MRLLSILAFACAAAFAGTASAYPVTLEVPVHVANMQHLTDIRVDCVVFEQVGGARGSVVGRVDNEIAVRTQPLDQTLVLSVEIGPERPGVATYEYTCGLSYSFNAPPNATPSTSLDDAYAQRTGQAVSVSVEQVSGTFYLTNR